jgi:hypothetical protein
VVATKKHPLNDRKTNRKVAMMDLHPATTLVYKVSVRTQNRLSLVEAIRMSLYLL